MLNSLTLHFFARPVTFMLDPKFLRMISVLIISASIIGCGNKIVVRDTNGLPIKDALVSTCYPSFNGNTTITNNAGVAYVGTSWLLDEIGISVNKGGYESEWYPWPTDFPITIILHKGNGIRVNGEKINLDRKTSNKLVIPFTEPYFDN